MKKPQLADTRESGVDRRTSASDSDRRRPFLGIPIADSISTAERFGSRVEGGCQLRDPRFEFLVADTNLRQLSCLAEAWKVGR